MDFFDMDFSKLFLDKHCKEIFDYISNTIKVEASNDDSFYISIVFKIAFWEFYRYCKKIQIIV